MLVWTRDWQKRRKNVSDGQLLFELNCARCHTAGWSIFDPTVPADQPGGADILGLPAGGGGLGGGTAFNLRDGQEIRRFGPDAAGGFDAQMQFVSDGSMRFKAYGNGGIGTGRMPGFSKMLTKQYIEEIVSYERYCLDTSTFAKYRTRLRHQLRPAPAGHHDHRGSIGEGITVIRLLITAAEGPAHPNLWNPTILGVLVVLSAIGLFCGSVYLLLGTNLGARLGFLVVFASLTGFMVLLTTLWWSSGNSGIDPPHGHSPNWRVVDVVANPSQSKIATAREALTKGTPADETELANLRPALDAALVHTAPVANVEPTPQPLAQFDVSARLPHRLQGLQDLRDRGRHEELVLAQRHATRPCSSAPPTPTRRRASPPLAIPCRTRSTPFSATTSARCASRWCSSSGSRRCCCSACRSSVSTGTSSMPASASASATAPVPVPTPGA